MSIVCGTDLLPGSEDAQEVAARLASKTHEELLLVHALRLPAVIFIAGEPLVINPLRPPSRLEMETTALDALSKEALRLSSLTGNKVVPRLSIGVADQVLLDSAQSSGAGLIVAGSLARSAPGRWLLGSTADRLVRKSACPVLVVKQNAAGLLSWLRGERPLRVLFGIDFEESFSAAAAAAKRLLQAGPCDFHYVHVYDLPTAGFYARDTAQPLAPATRSDVEPGITRAVERLAVAEGLPAAAAGHVHLLYGPASRKLVAFSTEMDFDLILAGTHGRRGAERTLLGSVALGVLHGATCPVLIAPLPPKGTA